MAYFRETARVAQRTLVGRHFGPIDPIEGSSVRHRMH